MKKTLRVLLILIFVLALICVVFFPVSATSGSGPPLLLLGFLAAFAACFVLILTTVSQMRIKGGKKEDLLSSLIGSGAGANMMRIDSSARRANRPPGKAITKPQRPNIYCLSP